MDNIITRVQVVVSQMYEKKGYVKPTDLVESARKKDSPIHDAFEWNDKKCGKEYRLIQARRWIRTVEVSYGDEQARLIHVPVVEGEGYYKPAHIIVESQDEYQAALGQAAKALMSARSAYMELKLVSQDFGKKLDHDEAENGFDKVEKVLANS